MIPNDEAEDRRARIWQYLSKTDMPQTLSEIAHATRMTKAIVRRSISDLIGSGEVRDIGPNGPRNARVYVAVI